MREDCRIEGTMKSRFLKPFAVCVMLISSSFGFTGRANAAYLSADTLCNPVYSQSSNVSHPDMGDYIDRTWYYLLDFGQYDYLDNRQYNLMGESGYLLGHPAYPRLFERNSEQAVGFAGKTKSDWFASGGRQSAIFAYAELCRGFNAGDLIDKIRYYYLDEGQYYYLDNEQYNLLGGLGYMFGRPSDLSQYNQSLRLLGRPAYFHNPEPATIGFLGFGALLIVTSRRYNEGRRGKTEPNRR